MMGDYVNEEKTIFRKRIIATPVMRKKSAAPVPRNSLALGRKEIPKTPVNHRGKSIGNASKHPKNIVYFEDEKPITKTWEITSEQYKNSFISGAELRRMENKLHIQGPGFNRENLFFYYCINLICKIGKPMEEFNIKHKNNFPKPPSRSNVSKQILKKETTNPHHYELEPLKITGSTNQNNLNQAGEKWNNMIASFVDSDGILFDDFINSRKEFEPQKISSTVGLIQSFFHSAKNWVIGKEKYFGLVHPNAEGAEYISLKDEITPNQMMPNVRFSAIGYGYQLPPAYRTSIKRNKEKKSNLYPHEMLAKNFKDEILAKLKKGISSNCCDLMESFEESSELRDTTYCANQSISVYISKGNSKQGSKKLGTICNKLEPNMIKDVFMNNFVTLYRVTKVDPEHITIEKETFGEPIKKSLEKKLDEMIARLIN
jgi:hypothetical protein